GCCSAPAEPVRRARPGLSPGSTFSVAAGQAFDAHLRHAAVQHAKALGGGAREVDHPALGIGAAVVDAYHHRPAVLQIGDLHLGTERQAAVGSSQLVLVEDLAAGGLATMETGAVPGGLAYQGLLRTGFRGCR